MDPVTALAVAGNAFQFAGLAVQVVQSLARYIQDVKAAPKQAIELRNEIAGIIGIVTTLKVTLEISPSSISAAQERPLNETITNVRETLEEILHKLKQGIDEKNVGGAQRLIWPFQKRKLEEHLEKLDRYKATLNFALQIEQTNTLHHVEEIVTTSLVHQLTTEAREILDWLCPPSIDPDADQAIRQSLRTQKTATWIFADLAFREWKDGKGTFFWLKAQMGVGKSILASSVIDKLLHERRANLAIGVAFFYCDGNSSERRKEDARYIFGSLIRQLIQETSLAAESPHFEQLQKLRKQPSRTILDTMVYTLEWISNLFDQVYVVIDGLDECEKRKPLLDTLLKLTNGKINLLLTSRPEKDIEKAFLGKASAEINADKQHRDIATHIKRHLEHDEGFENISPDLKIEISEKLLEKCSEVFRWVDCQLVDLREQLTPADIRRQLHHLPSGLSETYKRILDRIKKVPSRWKIARKTLMWLLFCQKRFDLQRLSFAVALDPSDNFFDNDKRVFRDEQLLETCTSLIRVVGNYVQFSHFSVIEYLTTRLTDGEQNSYFMDSQECHAEIMKCCLACFSFPDIGEAWVKEYRFKCYWYAIFQWHRHAKVVETDPLHRKAINAFLFGSERRPFDSWSSLQRIKLKYFARMDLDQFFMMKLDQFFPPADSPTGLFYAAFFGWNHVLDDLFKEKTLWIYQRSSLNAALLAASEKGFTGVINRLIEEGADIETQTLDGKSALHLAVLESRPSSVKLLLEVKAGVNVQDRSGAIPLLHAYQNEAILKMLLDAGADVTAHDRDGNTVLHVAVDMLPWVDGEEREAILLNFKRLLEAGADVTAVNNYGQSAVSLAIRDQNKEVLQLIYDDQMASLLVQR